MDGKQLITGRLNVSIRQILLKNYEAESWAIGCTDMVRNKTVLDMIEEIKY